jgi:hypothetical protein
MAASTSAKNASAISPSSSRSRFFVNVVASHGRQARANEPPIEDAVIRLTQPTVMMRDAQAESSEAAGRCESVGRSASRWQMMVSALALRGVLDSSADSG